MYTMSAPKRGQGVDRREQILDAALRVILRAGLDGVRSQTVATEAGVSVALPHYYWPTLTDLVRAVQERFGAVEEARETAALAAAGSPRAQLLALVVHGFAGTPAEVRDQLMLRTEFHGRALFDPGVAALVQEREARRLARAGALVTALQAGGELPVGVEPSLLAARVIGTADGLAGMVLLELIAPAAAIAQLEVLLAAMATWSATPLAPPLTAPVPIDAEGRDRRTSILDATIAVIAAEGVAGVHFPEVAVAAEVSQSLPRYYFPTITELVQAAFARDAERARRRVERRAVRLDNPLERLRDAYVHEVLAEPAALRPTWILWLEFQRIAARSPAARQQAAERLTDWMAYDAALIDELQRAGRVAPGVAVAAAVQRLVALLNGAGTLWMLGLLDGDQYAQTMSAAIDDELRLV